MTYEEILAFHGHECPGIAIGYRMTVAAMEYLSSTRSSDEELVAIVENDACGVDALQCLTGCTFGKGNLVFHDYGKQVYTIFSRVSGNGVRVLFHGDGVPPEVREERNRFTSWLLSAPAENFLSVKSVTIKEPDHAKIRSSQDCSLCGESVMETRLRDREGEYVCIPCFNKQESSS